MTALSINEDPELNAERVLVGDTRSEADVADAIKDVDAVVHLAALAHPSAGTPYDVYSVNVVSTFNVLAQAGALGIRRAVVASSINAFGIPINHHDVHPAYFPIDAAIPADLDDRYSLSKFSDEATAKMAYGAGASMSSRCGSRTSTRPRRCSGSVITMPRTRGAGCARRGAISTSATRRGRSCSA